MIPLVYSNLAGTLGSQVGNLQEAIARIEAGEVYTSPQPAKAEPCKKGMLTQASLDLCDEIVATLKASSEPMTTAQIANSIPSHRGRSAIHRLMRVLLDAERVTRESRIYQRSRCDFWGLRNDRPNH